jgi:hypothetical protein
LRFTFPTVHGPHHSRNQLHNWGVQLHQDVEWLLTQGCFQTNLFSFIDIKTTLGSSSSYNLIF